MILEGSACKLVGLGVGRLWLRGLCGFHKAWGRGSADWVVKGRATWQTIGVEVVCTRIPLQVRWADGYPTSWEPEYHVAPELIAAFAQQRPELFAQLAAAGGGGNGVCAVGEGHDRGSAGTEAALAGAT